MSKNNDGGDKKLSNGEYLSGKKLPTQHTLAKILGLSRTTVAEILGGKATHRYNEETRKRVVDAAKSINYRPHRSAQAIRRGRSNLIGIIHFGGAYEVSRQMRHYLIQSVRASGFDPAVMESTSLGGHSSRTIDQLLEARVEGVIISNTVEAFGVENVNVLRDAGIPVVTLAGQEEWNIPAVYEDIRSAMRSMVRHLTGLNHRRLLLLTNQHDSRAARTRIAGFVDGLKECGGVLIEDEPDKAKSRSRGKAVPSVQGNIVRIAMEREEFDLASAAYRYMQQAIKKGGLPDVILCHNDQWARGVFAAAYEAGLKVPEDIALTGFDNESFGAYPPFEFTTMSAPILNEAEKTVELLLDMMRGINPPQEVYFPCELVVRHSCGSARKGKGVAF